MKVWVIGDDWQGIYQRDGALIDENHNWSPDGLVENLEIEDRVAVVYLDEEQLERLENVGNLPEHWEDFVAQYCPVGWDK